MDIRTVYFRNFISGFSLVFDNFNSQSSTKNLVSRLQEQHSLPIESGIAGCGPLIIVERWLPQLFTSSEPSDSVLG